MYVKRKEAETCLTHVAYWRRAAGTANLFWNRKGSEALARVYLMRRNCMLDLIIVLVTLVIFVAFIGFTGACERL